MTESGEREDGALVKRVLSGDERAFNDLMHRHKADLYRFVRAYAGDAAEAYDLVQETFVAAWLALDRYDSSWPFAAWIRRIALNKCRDWSRRRRVRQFFYAAQDIDAPGLSLPDATPELPDERLDALESAIAGLPTGLKEPLILTVLSGLSHKEAGRVLGLTAKAVEVRVYRAKQKLSAMLGESAAASS